MREEISLKRLKMDGMLHQVASLKAHHAMHDHFMKQMNERMIE